MLIGKIHGFMLKHVFLCSNIKIRSLIITLVEAWSKEAKLRDLARKGENWKMEHLDELLVGKKCSGLKTPGSLSILIRQKTKSKSATSKSLYGAQTNYFLTCKLKHRKLASVILPKTFSF